jgi:hypothetical protein
MNLILLVLLTLASQKPSLVTNIGCHVEGMGIACPSDSLSSVMPQMRATATQHSATLSWNASAVGKNCAPPATLAYNVLRGSAAGQESTTPINPTPLTTTGYVDASVQMGQTYYWVVVPLETCANLVIPGPVSNEVSYQFPFPPSAAMIQGILAQ